MRIAVLREPGAEREVSPLELFFDLVYVFAISQLSEHLVAHVDLRTGAETLILALAVFYAWYMVAWGSNWLDPDPLPVRLVLIGLMFVSLLMSVAIDDAFGDRAWLFVTGYLLLQLGRAEAAEASDDAGAIGLWGTWTLTLIVLALIAIAVADELAIAHPGDDATLAFTILAFGGPALFLLAQLLFQVAALGRALRSRVLGLGALAVLAFAFAPLTLIAGSSAVLIAVAITDTAQTGFQAPSRSA